MSNKRQWRAWGVATQGASTDYYYGATLSAAKKALREVWDTRGWDTRGLKIYTEKIYPDA